MTRYASSIINSNKKLFGLKLSVRFFSLQLTPQLHSMRFNTLCGVLASLIETPKTKLRKELYEKVFYAAKRRWTEITEPRVLS